MYSVPIGTGWPARLALILGVAAATASAQSPEGPEFQVNTYTFGSQGIPAVAVSPDGSFVAAWSSVWQPGGDSSIGVRARIFQADGTPAGDGFQVETYTSEDQTVAGVAMHTDGSFVVVWRSTGSPGSDSSLASIQSRLYDSGGTPRGDQSQVNTYTLHSQNNPAIDMAADGSFVIVWESYGSVDDDTDRFSVQGRRFDALGNPLDDQFQVNSYTTEDQRFADVSVAADGGFVIVWRSDGSSGDDNDSYSIQARVFDSAGDPTSNEFQVNTYTTWRQRYPAVAIDESGFIVVWQSDQGDPPDTSGFSVQGQRFGPAGASIGSQFVVNSFTGNDQARPTVEMASRGGFVAAWQSVDSAGSDDDVESIQARRFGANGLPLGNDFQVNTYITGVQQRPGLAIDDLDNLILVWGSAGSNTGDNSSSGILGQRFSGLEIFEDGFESGDTTRWSVTTP